MQEKQLGPIRNVREIAVIPVIGGDEQGMYREFPPELHEAFEDAKKDFIDKQSATEDRAFLTLRGPVEREGKKVFVISEISFPT